MLEIPSKNHQTPGMASTKRRQPRTPKQAGRTQKQLGAMYGLKMKKIWVCSLNKLLFLVILAVLFAVRNMNRMNIRRTTGR